MRKRPLYDAEFVGEGTPSPGNRKAKAPRLVKAGQWTHSGYISQGLLMYVQQG